MITIFDITKWVFHDKTKLATDDIRQKIDSVHVMTIVTRI